MCLLFAIFVLLGPRAFIFFWWLLEPTRWGLTFQSAFVPVIGFLFLPWTTIMYVLVFPNGIEGLDWLWLAIGLAVDISSYGSSAYGNRGNSGNSDTWTTFDGV
ncbi:MAG: hypothetical protein A2Z32_07005 [Chloroflexi bacterium RBG_16_69_14]|nr:MAG: hypothetical protein A2Z32_07005 [Chloroflexi bacterium RBG_16_69_14]